MASLSYLAHWTRFFVGSGGRRRHAAAVIAFSLERWRIGLKLLITADASLLHQWAHRRRPGRKHDGQIQFAHI
jgi:hypothetical protein